MDVEEMLQEQEEMEQEMCLMDREGCLKCDNPLKDDCVLYKVARNNRILIPFVALINGESKALVLTANTYFEGIKSIPIYN